MCVCVCTRVAVNRDYAPTWLSYALESNIREYRSRMPRVPSPVRTSVSDVLVVPFICSGRIYYLQFRSKREADDLLLLLLLVFFFCSTSEK